MPSNMNNLPASITLDGQTWYRGSSMSATGTYAYTPAGSQSEAEGEVGGKDHITVCKANSGDWIHNMHIRLNTADQCPYYFWTTSKKFGFREKATAKARGQEGELKRLLTDAAIVLGYSLTAIAKAGPSVAQAPKPLDMDLDFPPLGK